MSYDYLFKLIFVGDTHVGKTAITDRLVRDRYLGRYDSTIGVDFACVNTIINKKDRIKAHIWDTAGQESFSSIISNYYKGIAGAAIVFDITRRDSFDRVDFWRQELQNKNTTADLSILLIANKKDKTNRVVTTEEAQQYAEKYNLLYKETSAKTGENINEAFLSLIQNIYEKMDPEKLGTGIQRHFLYDDKGIKILDNNYKKRNSCCCLS